MSKDLVEQQSQALAIADEVYGDVVIGAGMEGVSIADIGIPFLRILQALSPQVKKGPARIDGAEEGDIYNTVTQEVAKAETGVLVIPCGYKKEWIEWVPRESGGGLVQVHKSEAILSQTVKGGERGTKDVLPNGNEIVTTAYHSVLVLGGDGETSKAVISMSSTQLKKSRAWNGKMSGKKLVIGGNKVPAPTFAYVYRLTTVLEERDGNSWGNWEISDAGPVSVRDVALEAKSFYLALRAGEVDIPSAAHDEVTERTAATASDDSIPF